MRILLFSISGIAIVLAGASIVVFLSGGIPLYYQPFDPQNMRNIHVHEERLSGTRVVRISGMLVSSISGVKGYSVDSRTSTLRLTVYVGIYGPNLPFAAKNTNEPVNFDVVVPINDRVQRIAFGKRGIIIWQRTPGT